MENTLKSMTDFVLEHNKITRDRDETYIRSEGLVNLRWVMYDKFIKYAEFLKRPLELGMFVPCDENGEVLKETTQEDEKLCDYCSFPQGGRHVSSTSFGCEGSRCDSATDNYQDVYDEAKSRVLFEGFEYKEAESEEYYSLLRFPDEFRTPLYPKLWGGMTIEDLVKCNVTLTNNALKLWNAKQ